MKQELARRYLSQLMGWNSERARVEFQWLDLIARFKYDGYLGYLAGARFVETLLDWLQQFDESERMVAYDFVRTKLVYISSAEFQHLVELLYPETVRSLLSASVAEDFGIPKYLVWSRIDTREAYRILLRSTLFMGLSDGARLDTFRRANVGVIRNEQVVPIMEADHSRWESIAKALRRDTLLPEARFRYIFLVDDFTGSGLTLLRKNENEPWDGKLLRFLDTVRPHVGKEVSSDFVLVAHHHLASAFAAEQLKQRLDSFMQELVNEWSLNVRLTFGMVLPSSLPISLESTDGFVEIARRHYNPSIMTKSMRVGGSDAPLGFADCALPLILEHNTPNNSVSILWAEAEAEAEYPEMRPLFRRRQRHL